MFHLVDRCWSYSQLLSLVSAATSSSTALSKWKGDEVKFAGWFGRHTARRLTPWRGQKNVTQSRLVAGSFPSTICQLDQIFFISSSYFFFQMMRWLNQRGTTQLESMVKVDDILDGCVSSWRVLLPCRSMSATSSSRRINSRETLESRQLVER